MSKTNLTGIHPFELLDQFGIDSYRYYFMREMRFGEDGNFSFESMVERHNADLANGLGNLASRVLAMLGSYFDGTVPAPVVEGAESDLSERGGRRRCPLRRAHAGRPSAAGADRGLGHRRSRQPLPGGDRALEAREGREQARGARERPVRQRRDPQDPRRPDLPDHAGGRRPPVEPARPDGLARGSAGARARWSGEASRWVPPPPKASRCSPAWTPTEAFAADSGRARVIHHAFTRG